MKNVPHLTNISVLAVMIVFITFGTIFFPNTVVISEAENRQLEQFPTYTFSTMLNGTYFTTITNFFADNVYARDEMLEYNRMYVAWMKGNVGSFDYHSNTEAYIPTQNRVSIIRMGDSYNWAVALQGEQSFFVYRAQDDKVDQYIDVVNKVHEKYSEYDFDVVLAPTAYEFIDAPNLKVNRKTQGEVIANVRSRLAPKIKSYDLSVALRAHQDEYVYYKTDHHWTTLGAYYGYLQYANEAGLTVGGFAPSNFVFRGDFSGSFAKLTNDARIMQRKDRLWGHHPVTPYELRIGYVSMDDLMVQGNIFVHDKDGYTSIFGGDFAYMEMQTEVPNDEHILIIKDSYANAFIPYLVDNYASITIIDPRFFTERMSDVFNKTQFTKILFFNNAETVTDIEFVEKTKHIFAIK